MGNKATTMSPSSSATIQEAIERMKVDPDMRAEASLSAPVSSSVASSDLRPHASKHMHGHTNSVEKFLPLNVRGRTHYPSKELAALAQDAGGTTLFRAFTERFYEKAFADPHIDKFIRSHDDPHGERFANWIAEKMGLGTPWSNERETRPACPFHVAGRGTFSVVDRTSAHVAAWNSPKRAPNDVGKHFDLTDCRLWMRLHFWAAREAGLFEHKTFADYYVRFIGHFVSVYERTAPAFARDAARWSESEDNLKRYVEQGNTVREIMGVSLAEAAQQIPKSERTSHWPYSRV